MLFFYILSWFGLILQVTVVTLSIAAGLFYLAELVEEYTALTAKIIKYLILFNLSIYVCLLLFEELPYPMIGSGITAAVAYYFVLQSFPYFILTSLPFIVSIVLMIYNHYAAFSYFSEVWHPFSEVLAYFSVCLWFVPFAFFVSLSANENVLPTVSETTAINTDESDVISSYFNKKGKKYGLLSFLKYAQESILPQRIKKHF